MASIDSDSDFDDCMSESEYEPDELRPKTPEQKYLHAAIHDRDLDRARSFVENLSPECRQEITEGSSLMLAALDEDDPEFIRFLVEECNADLEKSMMNPYRDDKNRADSITPLNYAAKYHRTEAAVELMRLGANVNAVSTSSRVAVLHDACKNGTLDIVRRLIQHGADLTLNDIRGTTALMYGVYYVAVCRELIRSGADVNATDNDGNTALHLAARLNPEVVKLLMNNGADLFMKNDEGEDALCIASAHSMRDAVKFIRDQLPNDDVGHQALIRSHQLVGACYANRYYRRDSIGEALVEWKKAVRLREERRLAVTGQDDDVVSTPNSAYDNAVEVDSMVKFDEMSQDRNKIYMQSLLLKEKILGPTHRNTIESVMELAEFYLGIEDYGRGLRLLRHCIKLSRDRRVVFTFESLFRDELDLDLICCMINNIKCNKDAVNETVDFTEIYEFFKAVTDETRSSRHPTTEDNCFLKSYMEGVDNGYFMQIALFLVKLFFRLETNDVNTAQFRRLVHGFVRLNLRSLVGRTVLMKALCPFDPINYDDDSTEWLFFEVESIKLLLECGADIGETDYKGNSVLHLLAKSEPWGYGAAGDDPSEETMKNVAEMLLAFGAHFDARNNDGFTAVDYLSSMGLEFSAHMTLQCLAAQAIRRYKIPCGGILPKSLVDFVLMH